MDTLENVNMVVKGNYCSLCRTEGYLVFHPKLGWLCFKCYEENKNT